jgi:hypothetical protein
LDRPRLIGALIDFLVTVFVVIASITALVRYGDQLGRVVTAFEIVAVVVIALCLDVVAYAVPVASSGASLGGAITRRRVLDAENGRTLTLRRAVRRYFARRNLWRWQAALDRRQRAARPAGASDPLTRSWADRVVRSVVVRS